MCEASLTWDSIIDELGGTGEVAGALAQSLSTVSGWRSRGIPSPHWGGVVRLARAKDKSEIGFELLAALAALRLVEVDGARA
jgi:hypothetical protein